MNSHDKTIVLVGGGTGGHVVPLRIIAGEMFRINPNVKIAIITNRGYFERTKQIFKGLEGSNEDNLKIYQVSGGRFRRYGRSRLREISDVKTQILNIIDLFKTVYGIVQSKMILMKLKPAAIFCKGGTGALEFCFSARKRAPIVVHDSDSRPGMANAIVGKWAKRIYFGMPRSIEKLNDKDVVGIPVEEEFRPVDSAEISNLRSSLDLNVESKTVLVTGGSLGAKKINELIYCTINDLNKLGIQVLHQTGSRAATSQAKKIRKELDNPKLYRPFDFSSEMAILYGVADLVVGRAGATTIQELANAKKPAILIPASLSDQKKNAAMLKEMGATLIAEQDDLLTKPEEFISMVQFAVSDESLRSSLVDAMTPLARYDVGALLANKLLDISEVENV